MLRPLTRSVPASYLTQLGRFTLRDEGRTIGIGKCLKLLDDDEAAAATAK
jgi:translation elongation factor EF-1alpha